MSLSAIGHFPAFRPRRLRRTTALRRMFAETRIDLSQLVLPLFARPGLKIRQPIPSMPGVFQLSPDEVLRERASRSLEHVFTLLALVLSRQHLTIAFRALHTSDPMLRGTALEYLETLLPEPIRARLWPYLEDRRSARPAARPAADVAQDLLRSRQSIALNLEALRRGDGG